MANDGLAFRFSECLESIECYKCGIVFAVPQYWRQKRLEDHESFWCPNGHSQCYIGKTEAEKLRDELAATKRRLEIATQESAKEFQLRQRLEKRIANGVCPKCHRHFINVERHMKKKHAT